MTRTATPDDIPSLVEMGRRFHAMSPHKPFGAYDHKAVTNVLSFLIANPDGLVVTNGDGAIGGFIAPLYFDPSRRAMEEAFWWASSGGKDLLTAFEAESRKMGASLLFMSGLENEHVKAIDRVFRRAGFSPVERRYVKEL